MTDRQLPVVGLDRYVCVTGRTWLRASLRRRRIQAGGPRVLDVAKHDPNESSRHVRLHDERIVVISP